MQSLPIAALVMACGPAFADLSCDAAVDLFAANFPDTLQMRDELGAPLADVLEDKTERWRFVVTTYIGATLSIDGENVGEDIANRVVAGDRLITCWREEAEGLVIDDALALEEFDEIFTAERREAFLAKAQEKL
ncbi:hypothetical protein [uncultured Roseobacter sp.]|uniref:hypothetical protein n=1 Tax=uncultured Roseobacter sp. TaxID=114847 RepID=UPI002603D033|nr:hypothetical protein [uncultured Roseobacter sp.]